MPNEMPLLRGPPQAPHCPPCLHQHNTWPVTLQAAGLLRGSQGQQAGGRHIQRLVAPCPGVPAQGQDAFSGRAALHSGEAAACCGAGVADGCSPRAARFREHWLICLGVVSWTLVAFINSAMSVRRPMRRVMCRVAFSLSIHPATATAVLLLVHAIPTKIQ